MDIGTAKPTADERRRVPHHALDLVRPDEAFDAARWAAVARAAIADIAARGRLPIVVGGTGLYYRALVTGLFEAPPPDEAIRARHRAEAAADGVEALHARLAAIDPEAAAAIRVRDLVRISRALEVYEQTGVPITTLRRRAAPPADLAPDVLLLDPPVAGAARAHRRARRTDDGGRLPRRGARAARRRLRARAEAVAGARLQAAGRGARRDSVAGGRRRRDHPGHVRLRAPAAHLVPQAGGRAPLRGRAPRSKRRRNRGRGA